MAANPAIARQWFLAQWLTRVRWAGIPLGLILLILFPADTLLGTIALVLALGLGNGGITLLLRRGLEPRRLRLVRASASVMGWGVGAGLLVLYNREPVSDSPALLLILILLTGLRYGLRGTIAAMAGAALGVGGFIGTQALILHVLAVDLAMRAFIIWELLVILMTLTVAGMVQASDALWRWETARWANQQRMLQRLSMRLSPQELRLLPLLARKDLKYEQIAAILCISPETVKTHVRRLGGKLGVRGRWEVVAATRTYGLMPGDE